MTTSKSDKVFRLSIQIRQMLDEIEEIELSNDAREMFEDEMRKLHCITRAIYSSFT